MSADLQAGATVAQALNKQLQDRPVRLSQGNLRFVPQTELPAGEAYEAFIHRRACVPSRDNLHDLLNGLIWLHWPVLKAGLNAAHIEALLASGSVQAQRGPLRDALTVVDENAALLHAPAELCDALIARDWHALFIRLRPLWAQASLQLVGHALLEKLMQPRKPICAHVLITPYGPQSAYRPSRPCSPGEGHDLAMPDAPLDPAWLASKPFYPMPVLGVPGWWAGNEDENFYADTGVFRPALPVQSG